MSPPTKEIKFTYREELRELSELEKEGLLLGARLDARIDAAGIS